MDLRVIWSSPARAVLMIVFSTIGVAPAFAAVTSEEKNTGLIEIEYPVETLLPYRERRPKNQVSFNFQYENYAPTGLATSTLGNFAEIYGGSEVPILSGAIGWKHNIPYLGLEVSAFYGNGGLVADNIQGEKLNLDITKYGLKFGAYLETLFKEPYVVPYAAVQVQSWNVSETGGGLADYSHNTGYAVGLQVGALIQLNWLEPDSSLQALNESGLTNTYLDVFAQQYGDTSESTDPKMASDFNWGVGLRFEY